MKKRFNLLQVLGVLLVLGSCAALFGSEIMAQRNAAAAEALTTQLVSRLPAPVEGDPESYSDPAMPVLQLNGEDFSGLVRVPAFGVTLPIGNDWNTTNLSQYPCRFWGSAYDHSLIIGGSGQKGQFDFCTKLDLGNQILITDMAGAEFSYEVMRIDRREHTDMDTFLETDCDLILFARDTASKSYIIVRCQFAA